MNTAAQCPRSQQLSALVNGKLPDDLKTQLEQHLESCAICLQTLRELVSDGTSWSFLAEDVPHLTAKDTSLVNLVEQMKLNPLDAETQAEPLVIGCASDFLEPSDEPNSIGRLGPYVISESIGRGGMGVVLKGHDSKLNRVVAVKVLAPEFASSVTARKRFLRESQAAAAVGHPHVVTIFAVDEGRLPYLVMEYVDGQSLQEKIDREGSLELTQILRIASQAAAGLAAAHEQGLVHRDIKPANILLENGVERVKVTDFGLARAVDDVAITRTGEVAGTPQYMSPEQADGQVVDHRTDLFSLGSVIYAMCTGRPPFRAQTTLGVMRRVCEDTPRPVHEIDEAIPLWLANLVQRLLSKDPERRFQSAAELAEILHLCLAHVQHPSANPAPSELQTLQNFSSSRSTRRRWSVVAAILLLAVTGLGLADGSGLTEITSTVIRVVRGDGMMVIRVDDPNVRVSIDGDEVVLSGAGPREVRVRPGEYDVVASKDGVTVHTQRVTIERGGQTLVDVTQESATSAQAEPQTPTNRLVWDNAIDFTFSGKPSPDGNYVSYVDWDTGNLGVHDFRTNEDRLLTKEGWPQQAWNSVFSPDGQRIAYSWHAGGNSCEMRVVSVKGSEPTTLYDQGDWIVPTAWSPNGKWIAAFLDKRDEYHDIALVSTADGSVLRLTPYKGTQRPWMCFSPDSRYLAVTLNQDKSVTRGHDKGDIVILPTDGSGERFPVVEHPSDDLAIGWTNDGSGLLFTSDRTGSSYIYALTLDDHRRQGEPEPISEIGEYMPLGFDDKGSFYYGRNVPGQNVYGATIDMESRMVLEQPTKLMRLYEGRQSTPEWSSDGKLLACRAGVGGEPGLLIKSMDDGTIRRVIPDGATGINYHFLRWSPDDTAVMVAGIYNNTRALLEIDITTGAVQVLAEGRIFDCDWSPDGKTVYFERRDFQGDDERWILVRRDLASGQEKELYPTGRIERLCVSPNGKQLAYMKSKRIYLLSVDGGEPKVLLEKKGLSTQSLAWTPDGRYLLAVGSANDRSDLWRVSVETGEPEATGFSVVGSRIPHLCIHPDGKQIAYRHVADKTQAWVIENLLPRH